MLPGRKPTPSLRPRNVKARSKDGEPCRTVPSRVAPGQHRERQHLSRICQSKMRQITRTISCTSSTQLSYCVLPFGIYGWFSVSGGLVRLRFVCATPADALSVHSMRKSCTRCTTCGFGACSERSRRTFGKPPVLKVPPSAATAVALGCSP